MRDNARSLKPLVGEELEEEINKYLIDFRKHPHTLVDVERELRDAAIFFADWQRQQIMKDAVNGIVYLNVDSDPYEKVIKTEAVKEMIHNELVKVIIIKEN